MQGEAGDMSQAGARGRQSAGFLALYALAWAGGAIAYVPFLTIMLPSRLLALEPGGDSVSWLSTITLVGAICASTGNIVAGWLSDLTRTRRPWIAAGLAINLAVLMQFAGVDSANGLILLIVPWQLSLNLMLGPLGAWAGDCVPDAQKGILGGLLSLAPSGAALVGFLVAASGAEGLGERLGLVALVVAACIAPVLVVGRPRPVAAPARALAEIELAGLHAPRATVLMWLARLLLQMSEAAMFAFLLLYFRSVGPGMSDSAIAAIYAAILAASVPLALVAGRWSDRTAKPMVPLAVSAGIGGAGLLVMAASASLTMAIAGYVVFGVSAAVFLALHAGQTLRVLPRPDRRGRDLGLFNLTNTIPSVLMPLLAFVLMPALGFPGLLGALALLAFGASAITARLVGRT